MSELEQLHNSETTDTSYDHVLKYTGIFGGVQVLKLLLAAIRNKLTSIFLGAIGVGLISIYNSIFEFLVSSSSLGIPFNATRESSELFEEGTNSQIEHFVMVVRTWVVWTSLLAIAIGVACAILMGTYFDAQDWSARHILFAIPVAVTYLVAEGECAILKGLRQLKKVATIEAILSVTTLLLTIPFYFLFGLKGVIIGLIASGLASVLIHFYYSLRLVSYRIKPFSLKVFREGIPLVKVGVPYVLAGVSYALLLVVVRHFIFQESGMADVGFFAVGWQLIIGYSTMVFVALESDYFPRLSSVNHDITRMNQAVNQQIEVCTLIVTPFLIVMALGMPWIIQLLNTNEFLVVTNMALCALFYTFFRAIALPINYCTLAKGDSLLYLVLEVIYNVLFGILLWWTYSNYGLVGTGVAMSFISLYDLIVYQTVCRIKYGTRISRHTWILCGVQFVCLSVVLSMCFFSTDAIKYFVGGAVWMVSSAYSIYCLNEHSDVLHALFKHFK